MKTIQVALDLMTTSQALKVLEEIYEYIDIIELGTPLMISEGVSVIESVKERYPDKAIFSDIKIMDGGSIMAELVFNAGADMVSVLATANDQTIEDVIQTAKKYNKKVLIDMVAVDNVTERAKELAHLNPEYICIHIGTDVQDKGIDPIEELSKLKNINIKKAVAGGIKLDTFQDAVDSVADNIIVGSAIYDAESPGEVARKMRKIIERSA